MKYLLTCVALLGMGQTNQLPTQKVPIEGDCLKGFVCTSGNTTTKPQIVPAQTVLLAPALNHYIEKHCRVVGKSGASIGTDTTIGQIKCDQ